MNGQQLIDALRGWINRYCGVTPAQSLVLAIWALHTHVYEKLTRTSPYLEITGVSGSGKTTIMEALGIISRGSLLLTTIRTLALARYITNNNAEVTIFIDEAERLRSSAANDQRSMLASGYREGGKHLVTNGDETKLWDVYCPKAFASTATMTSVLHNRAISIWAERRKTAASLSLERERAEATAAEILAHFDTAQFKAKIMQADWLVSERDAEIWTPLVSLALSLGANKATMDELIAASVDLSSLRGVIRTMDQKTEDDSAKERSYAARLIRDSVSVFHDGEDRILARVLVERLHALPSAPWRSYNRQGLNEISLAHLLGAVGVPTSTQIQIRVAKGKDGRVGGRGYYLKDLKAGLKQVEDSES